MKHKIDPRQNSLFDPERQNFSRVGYDRLDRGWQGIFRRSLLAVMPADELATEFSGDTGRLSKELYSMAGLVVITEMRGWTSQEAADAYMFDLSVQYALNVGHQAVELSYRTVERYQRLFRERELAQDVFERVTKTLAEELQIEVDKQRLDSTHLFSDMAILSRTQLMAVCIRRFLIQLKRHQNNEYALLDAQVRERCMASDKRLFSQTPPEGNARAQLRQRVAEDLLMLIDRFAGHERITSMSSYKAMVRVFSEQCKMVGGKVALRKKTGGRTMQNPSDPDATYDGHKGKGYQVQLSETCHPDNPVQLITCAIPQTAADEDGDALPLVVDQLEQADLKPDKILADTLYGSDDNQQLCEDKDIDLVAPVRGPAPKKNRFPTTDAQKRLASRRSAEKTEEWRHTYRLRAGIEGTNSGLKRRMELGKLRVRGKKSVFNVVLLKATGWNIFRAADAMVYKTKRTIQTRIIAPNAALSLLLDLLGQVECPQGARCEFRSHWQIKTPELLVA
ncbi:MAG: transposase [Kiritimatiellae bacterium]|nr:transposase [Kiritimatiellia bacterium]